MNEMSVESLIAIGTGMVASHENLETQDNTTIDYDGYSDGANMNLTRASEELHFMDTYNKLQSLHSAEKLRMIKKIQTSYKNINNTNVANSVESFCNNAMSTEDVEEVIDKVKAKFIEIFKKIGEFFKNLVVKVVSAKYKGPIAEEFKGLLLQVHTNLNDIIKRISTTPRDDYDLYSELVVKQRIFNDLRTVLIHLLDYVGDVVDNDSPNTTQLKKVVLKYIKDLKNALNQPAFKSISANGIDFYKEKKVLDNIKKLIYLRDRDIKKERDKIYPNVSDHQKRKYANMQYTHL